MSAQICNSGPARATGWACIEVHLPGRCAVPIGILLADDCSDFLCVELRSNWWIGMVDADEYELWAELSNDLRRKAQMMGGKAFQDWLRDSCSHTIRLSAVEPMEVRATVIVRTGDKAVPVVGVSESEPNGSEKSISMIRECRPAVISVASSPNNSSWRRSWLSQGTIAAGLLFSAAWAGFHSARAGFKDGSHPTISTELRLALPPAGLYRRLPLELDSPVILTSRGRERKRRHLQTRGIPSFVTPSVDVATRPARIAVLPPPSCCDYNYDVDRTEYLQLLVQSEPELPEYRPRHSKFLRIMAAVANPFRFITSRD